MYRSRGEVGGILKHRVEVDFDDFGWARLTAEAERQGTTVDELLAHAAAYFLADLDEGRFSSRIYKSMLEEDSPDRHLAGPSPSS